MHPATQSRESEIGFAVCMAMFGAVLWIEPRNASFIGPFMILYSLAHLWASNRPQPANDLPGKPLGMWRLAVGFGLCLIVIAIMEWIHPGPPDSFWIRLIAGPLVPLLVLYHFIAEHNRKVAEEADRLGSDAEPLDIRPPHRRMQD